MRRRFVGLGAHHRRHRHPLDVPPHGAREAISFKPVEGRRPAPVVRERETERERRGNFGSHFGPALDEADVAGELGVEVLDVGEDGVRRDSRVVRHAHF